MVFSTVLTGIIYCLLAFEVLATLLLSLPLGAGNAIVKLFASSTLTAKLKVPFGVVVLSIALVLLDAVRKLSGEERKPHDHQEQLAIHRKHLKNERNLVMAFFALFMLLVLYNFATQIRALAKERANSEALKKQADGMKAAYDQLEKDAKEPKKLSDDNEKLKSELDKLRGEHEKLQSELEKTKKEKAAEVEAIKKQAESQSQQFLEAQERNMKLRDELDKARGDPKKTK